MGVGEAQVTVIFGAFAAACELLVQPAGLRGETGGSGAGCVGRPAPSPLKSPKPQRPAMI